MKTTKTARTALVTCILVLAFIPAALGEQSSDEHIIFMPLAMQQYDSSLTWLEPSSVDLVPWSMYSPLSIIDKQGRLHLFWDTLEGPSFIYHTMQTNNGWTEPAPVSNSLGLSSTLSEPFVDNNGIIHLLWKNWLGTGSVKPYRLLYSSFDGNRWSSEEEVVRADNDLNGVIHSREGGEIQISFYYGSFPTRYFYTIRSGSGWGSIAEITPSTNVIVIRFGYDIVLGDSMGGIHVYAITYLSQEIRYSYWRNGSWLVRDRVLDVKTYEPRIQLDGLSNLHLFWTGTVPVPGGHVNGLYHQCVEDNRVLLPREVPSSNQAVYSVARASDQVSKTGLAWRESGSKFRLGTWEGCTSLGVRNIPFPTELNLELTSLAMSADPGKVCAVGRVPYGNTHVAMCGEVRR
jgi:hypothetical protein